MNFHEQCKRQLGINPDDPDFIKKFEEFKATIKDNFSDVIIHENHSVKPNPESWKEPRVVGTIPIDKIEFSDLEYIGFQGYQKGNVEFLRGVIEDAPTNSYPDDILAYLVENEKFKTNKNYEAFADCEFIYNPEEDKYYLANRNSKLAYYIVALKKMKELGIKGINYDLYGKVANYNSPNLIDNDKAMQLTLAGNKLGLNIDVANVLDENSNIEYVISGLCNSKGILRSNFKMKWNNLEDYLAFSTRLEKISYLIGLGIKDKFSVKTNEHGELVLLYENQDLTDDILNSLLDEQVAIHKSTLEEVSNRRSNSYSSYQKAVDEYNSVHQENIQLQADIEIFNNSRNSLINRLRYMLSDKKAKEVNFNTMEYEPTQDFSLSEDKLDNFSELKQIIAKTDFLKQDNKRLQELISLLQSDITATRNITSQNKDNFGQLNSSFFGSLFKETKPIEYSKAEQQEIIMPIVEEVKKEEIQDDKSEKQEEFIEHMNYQQNIDLTQEEKDALLMYKSNCFMAMNELMDDYRTNGKYSEKASEILKRQYDTAKEQYEANQKLPPIFTKGNSDVRDPELLIGDITTISLEDYSNNILRYMEPLQSALTKIGTPEDIIVYRAVTEENLHESIQNSQRFLSTSIDSQVSASFYDGREQNNRQLVMYKILLPKGSPAIAYSPSIMAVDPSMKATDDQKEILIDGALFDIEIIGEETIYSDRYNVNNNNVKQFNQQMVQPIKVISLSLTPKQLQNRMINQNELTETRLIA